MKPLRTLTILFIVALFAVTATANTITAPEAVVADGSGHFGFAVVVEITSTATFASLLIDGTDNTDLGLSVADGFCAQVLSPGIYPEVVTGNLVDLGVGGTVTYEYSVCEGWVGTATVSIIAPTVATVQDTWGAIKALYR